VPLSEDAIALVLLQSLPFSRLAAEVVAHAGLGSKSADKGPVLGNFGRPSSRREHLPRKDRAVIMRVRGLIIGAVVGCALVAGGWLVGFRVGKPIRDQAVASSRWPTTEGRIVCSRREQSVGDTGGVQLTADIGYEYELDGATFTGSRIWIGDDYTASPGGEFRSAVDRYPVGRRVRVHYDPLMSAEGVLERGPTWSGSLFYFLGLAMLAFGTLILLMVLIPSLLAVLAMAGAFDRGTAAPADDCADPRHPSGGVGGAPSGATAAADDGITIR
jgi:hypothetical protein